GAAPVLAGLLSLNIPLKLVAGTSLMIVTINTISALTAHFLVGEIDLTMVCLLALGSVAGAFSGPYVLSRLKTTKAEGPVRKWYAFAMIIFGIIILIF
ncbi:MAG: TSUP family transporter, partial [Prolixibacteraceae bacterium]|nr:TSUP family transporter [Prolixibacteraceae bacterium]